MQRTLWIATLLLTVFGVGAPAARAATELPAQTTGLSYRLSPIRIVNSHPCADEDVQLYVEGDLDLSAYCDSFIGIEVVRPDSVLIRQAHFLPAPGQAVCRSGFDDLTIDHTSLAMPTTSRTRPPHFRYFAAL